MHGKLCCLFIDEVYHNHESFLYFFKGTAHKNSSNEEKWITRKHLVTCLLCRSIYTFLHVKKNFYLNLYMTLLSKLYTIPNIINLQCIFGPFSSTFPRYETLH